MDEHTLNGFCPSLSRPNNRDPHCPACHTMDLPENSDRAQVAALGSAGPAAGAGLDVERLVEAIGRLMDDGQIVDTELREAFIRAADGRPGSGIRALVLAALGIEEAPAASSTVSLFDQRQAELRPLRHLAYQAGQLCTALCNKQVWYEGKGKDNREMYARIERILERARSRDWRRRGHLEEMERRPLRPETTTTRRASAAPSEEAQDVE